MIHLTEDDTTSSSRIFIKILFQVCEGLAEGWLGAAWQMAACALVRSDRWVLYCLPSCLPACRSWLRRWA